LELLHILVEYAILKFSMLLDIKLLPCLVGYIIIDYVSVCLVYLYCWNYW